MAVSTLYTLIADTETELVASGVSGQANNDRNGKPINPIPAVVRNMGPGTLYVAGVDNAGTGGYPLEPGDQLAFDLVHSIGLETSDAEMVYGYADGECTVHTLYTRQGEPSAALA